MNTVKVLNNIDIEEVDIKSLVKTINNNIKLIHNRQHIISHLLFISLMDKNKDEVMEELAGVFKTRIIPLLLKYFDNDWEKIRLILGDDKKIGENGKYQLIKSKNNSFLIDEQALLNPISYKKVYER